MCDHCRTYKPLLEGGTPPPFYEQQRPKIIDIPQARPPPRIDYGGNNGGCCSWRASCCDGGCCDQVGSCCSSEMEPQFRPPEKPMGAYGAYGGYPQPAMASYSMGAFGSMMPDRVPCTQGDQKKMPMCFGGDCAASVDSVSRSSDNQGGNGSESVKAADETAATSEESEKANAENEDKTSTISPRESER